MKILVVGDSCTDKFIYGDVNRICPEAPVPIFNPIDQTENPGMAANVAENVKSLGIDVDLVCNWNLITKTRYVDIKSNQMLLRVDDGDAAEPITYINKYTIEFLNQYDAIIISDYNKGFISEYDIKKISSNHHLVFMDTKKLLGDWASECTFIKLIEHEYNKNKQFIDNNLDTFNNKIIITLGEEGCKYKNKVYPVEKLIEVKDVSGAGDTFISAFVSKYLKSKNIKESIEFAQKCSSFVVSKKGVVTV